ncbi:MAG: GNAT family N-acetyltransferase [Bacteroidota bacterium]|nr:GNAT family N-acetyltransferase [Bacteroidota bacterium]
MIIRKAQIEDLGNIMIMYNSCVVGMIKNNIDQWDETYPSSEIIAGDIKSASFYVAEIDNEIVGGVNIDNLQDSTYLAVNWEDDTNQFLVVHRLGVKVENWGYGIGKSLMIFAEKLVKEKGLKSIRLDTYSGNPKAMEFYLRLGYAELGTIDLKPNKNKYHCFEKIIK